MVCAAQILSARLHACRFSLLRCAHRHLLHRRSPPSPSRAWPQIRHYSLSPLAIQPLLYAGSAADHRRELQTQTQTQVGAEYIRRDSDPCWPEWSSFLKSLAGAGYSNASADLSATENVVPDFPAELLGPASVCLTFARDRPTLLGMLRMSDIEVVVQNGTPFYFKDGDESERRMRSYVGFDSNNELDMDEATMIDLMKYILSYISNPSAPDAKSGSNIELLESSLKNLLSELTKLSYRVHASGLSGSIQSLFFDEHKQPLSSVKKIEMKRGDWICPRCSFMNFARNVKCLECEEARPKRQFLNGEWECPQCDFFNYKRNTECFRCECKRPGDISLGPINLRSVSGLGDVNRSVKADSVSIDLERKLAANEEKAQKWFSKVSEVNSTSDMSSAMEDEDFPEIMPLRKGVNKFVVSTRKAPLERRLANSVQHQSGPGDGSNSVNEILKERISTSLDQILGHSPAASESNSNVAYSAQTRASNLKNPVASHPSDHLTGEKTYIQTRIVSSSQCSASDPLRYEKPDEANDQLMGSQTWNREPTWGNMDENSMVAKRAQFVANSLPSRDGVQQNRSSGNPWENNNNRWGDRYLNDQDTRSATNVTGTVRNLTTDLFKPRTGSYRSWFDGSGSQENENIAASGTWTVGNLSQRSENGSASTSFASHGAWSSGYSHQANASSVGTQHVRNPSQNTVDPQTSQPTSWNNGYSHYETSTRDMNAAGIPPQTSVAPNICSSNTNWSSGYSHQANASSVGTQHIGNPSQNTFEPQTNQPTIWNKGHYHYETATRDTNMAGIPPQTSVSQNTSACWSGQSLEGSGVREPDALDMSEEAKAERWFKRVAVIKDISELSKIPDEDFPSIMPMRKGVNRFVLSKRKTPLERRLTSQQYRRNLPTVTSSESLENENEE